MGLDEDSHVKNQTTADRNPHRLTESHLVEELGRDAKWEENEADELKDATD